MLYEEKRFNKFDFRWGCKDCHLCNNDNNDNNNNNNNSNNNNQLYLMRVTQNSTSTQELVALN